MELLQVIDTRSQVSSGVACNRLPSSRRQTDATSHTLWVASASLVRIKRAGMVLPPLFHSNGLLVLVALVEAFAIKVFARADVDAAAGARATFEDVFVLNLVLIHVFFKIIEAGINKFLATRGSLKVVCAGVHVSDVQFWDIGGTNGGNNKSGDSKSELHGVGIVEMGRSRL
jgi:hypothetical protein